MKYGLVVGCWIWSMNALVASEVAPLNIERDRPPIPNNCWTEVVWENEEADDEREEEVIITITTLPPPRLQRVPRRGLPSSLPAIEEGATQTLRRGFSRLRLDATSESTAPKGLLPEVSKVGPQRRSLPGQETDAPRGKRRPSTLSPLRCAPGAEHNSVVHLK